MNLFALRAERDVAVVHPGSGAMHVLTPEGAVFDSFDTDDLTQISIAYGRLFDDGWRYATESEVEAWKRQPRDRMLAVHWVPPVTETKRERVKRLGIHVVK
jgi:hypothetical protein